jgi:HK97 gp10 family phage protein
MDIKFDMNGFRAQITARQDKMRAATRPAAQAGVQVIYEAARLLCPVAESAHYFYGTSYKKTGQRYGPFRPGNLRDSIYQVFSKDNSTPSKAVYHMSWNRDKAPYGHMVELGTSKAPAHSFVGAAVHDFGGRALNAMKQTFVEKVSQ